MSGTTSSLASLSTRITKGTTPTTLGYAHSDSGIPFLRVQNIFGGEVNFAEDTLFIGPDTHAALRRSQIQTGDVLVTIAGTIGRTGVVPPGAPAMNCNQAVAIVRPTDQIERTYLRHWLESQDARGQMLGSTVTGTISNLSLTQLGELRVPLPSLAEQRRIAAILDQADALRAKRREALAQLDSLTQSIFDEMFGDPLLNPKCWPVGSLGSMSSKFSDGPFGSNLKSEHYTEQGVRIVRLQNIGVGEFVDKDRAYISQVHFQKLAKHQCRPGDILVATMGDPNLRACILPEWLPMALNKADCVQIRAEEGTAFSAYICSLINHPSTLLLAKDLMHGQTRVRINMGSLRALHVPIPPIGLQREFAVRMAQLARLRTAHLTSAAELDALFTSLQHRAFRGEL